MAYKEVSVATLDFVASYLTSPSSQVTKLPGQKARFGRIEMDTKARLDLAGYIKSLDPFQQWVSVAAIIAAYLLVNMFHTRTKRFVDVPVAGHSGLLSSYVTAFKALLNGYINITAGYEKYKGRAFKSAELSRWHVFISGSELMDQLRKAPEDVLLPVAAKEHLSIDALINHTLLSNKYHNALVSNLYTRQISHFFPALSDELRQSFEANIPQTDDWVPVKMMDTMLRSVVRITNRVFVGETLCRNEEWITINVKFTIDCFLGSKIVRLFPEPMQRFVGRWLTMAPSRLKAGEKLIIPLIEERIELINKLGKDSEELPNDSITWLLNHAPGAERSPKQIASRIMAINVAAIHSTATNSTQILYMLCAYPEYVNELRAEVEAAIDRDGWSKDAMMKCRKLDSFIKETLRLWPANVATLERVALKSFNLVDGTLIPKGTRISGILGPMMRDPVIWGPDAGEFDGFRFSRLRAEDESESTKHQMVQTSLEFAMFGHGQHACPGRFFAANELKALTAYVLLHYDIKFKNAKFGHGEVPEMLWFGTAATPNPYEEVLFRKRQT